MNSKQLLKARAYEAEREKDISPDERPAFHLSARVGWMNDPNGFCHYQGRYHLFYQYHPYETQWGPMHWAHVTSEDLLSWENLPCALAPDQPCDEESGCFSGSAIELPDGRHLLMYSSALYPRREDGAKDERQIQCVAVGDGLNYRKAPHNPVLTAEDLPEGASHVDFRDPKVWRGGDGVYRAAIASRPADGSGQILLYKSTDALHWRYEKVLAENRCRFGRMWECPDFFTLDGKGVLLVSPQEMRGEEPYFHPGNGNIAFIGHYDEAKDTFTEESAQVIDDGTDFYAMQTMLAPDGRRIMIAWMQNWDIQEHVPGEKWFGQMTLPREIWIRDGHLCQRPVREIERLRIKKASHAGAVLGAPVQLEGIKGRFADMHIAVRGDYGRFAVNLAQDERHRTTLTYDAKAGRLTLDRSQSGTRRAFLHSRSCAFHAGEELRLRVIMDQYSVEVFAGEGEKTLTMVLFTPLEADGMTFEADGSAMMDVTLYELKH